MHAPRARRLLIAVLLLSACGKSKEEQRMDQFRASCLALTGQTLNQAVQTLTPAPLIIDCSSPGVTHLANSTCPYATQYICRGLLLSCANDLGLCGPPPLGGCLYFCEVQFPGVQNAPADGTMVICGERFVSGQYGYIYGCIQ